MTRCNPHGHGKHGNKSRVCDMRKNPSLWASNPQDSKGEETCGSCNSSIVITFFANPDQRNPPTGPPGAEGLSGAGRSASSDDLLVCRVDSRAACVPGARCPLPSSSLSLWHSAIAVCKLGAHPARAFRNWNDVVGAKEQAITPVASQLVGSHSAIHETF